MANWKVKPNTYVNNLGEEVTEKVLVGSAKLVSPVNMSEKGLLTKENGKTYRLCTIEAEGPSGKSTQYLAQVATRNIELAEEQGIKLEVGKTFLTTLNVVPDKNNPGKTITFARMSHLTGIVTDAEVDAEFAALLDNVVADVDAPVVKLEGVEEEVGN